jgi:hypothetical protein
MGSEAAWLAGHAWVVLTTPCCALCWGISGLPFCTDILKDVCIGLLFYSFDTIPFIMVESNNLLGTICLFSSVSDQEPEFNGFVPSPSILHLHSH